MVETQDVFSTASVNEQEAQMKGSFPKVVSTIDPANLLATWQEEIKVVQYNPSQGDEEIKDWIVKYKEIFVEADRLMAVKAADEKKPFAEKYEARDLLEKHAMSIKPDWESTSQVVRCIKAMILCKLGGNYYDAEEVSESARQHQKAEKEIMSVCRGLQLLFANLLQDILNGIGIVMANREDATEAVEFLERAEKVYKDVEQAALGQGDIPSLVNLEDVDKYLLQALGHQQLDVSKLEVQLTNTSFYLAQVYSKANQVEKGIQKCGLTMRRQLSSKQYQIKDWVLNCINLSDFFVNAGNYCQAQYILQAANKILPEDANKKKKLRASVAICWGHFYTELLSELTYNYSQGQALDSEVLNKETVRFEELDVKWPEIANKLSSVEDASKVFRLGNTQIQKALKFFIADGWVSEHVRLVQNLSRMYKSLMVIEMNRERVHALIERRINLLTPLQKELNPQSYSAYMQEFAMELSDIYAVSYDLKSRDIEQGSVKLTKESMKDLNRTLDLCIKNSNYLAEAVEKSEEKFEYLQAYLNMKLQMAQKYTKYLEFDIKKQVEYHAKALRCYQSCKQFVEDYKKAKNLSDSELGDHVNQQIQICDSMIELLPQKVQQMMLQNSRKAAN